MPDMPLSVSGVSMPDVREPRREIELAFEEPMAPPRDSLDPMDPRSAVDPVLASEEEIFGSIGRDPFRMTERHEQLCLCEPFVGRVGRRRWF